MMSMMSGTQHQPHLCDVHHCIRLLISVWIQYRRPQPTNKGSYSSNNYL